MIRALFSKVGDVGVPPYLTYIENTLSMKLPPRGSDGNATCSFLNWIYEKLYRKKTCCCRGELT